MQELNNNLFTSIGCNDKLVELYAQLSPFVYKDSVRIFVNGSDSVRVYSGYIISEYKETLLLHHFRSVAFVYD